MMPTSLPRRLQILRAERGLTLVEAAERTGVGRDTLSDLERGRRRPVMPTLAKIARGYGVPVEELLEEPALAGKAEAPPTAEQLSFANGVAAADEERRQDLHDTREMLADLYDLLRELAQMYRSAGDAEKFKHLAELAALSSLGAIEIVVEEVGSTYDQEARRADAALSRYNDLVDGLAAEAAEEGTEGATNVTRLEELRQRKRAG